MATLATQTGILMIPWILTWIMLLKVVIIGAENLDPVQFTFSANFPKNKSLIPLPKHFDKFGDADNDCCTLLLFFEVKDLNMDGTGNDAPEMEGAQAQTGTGQATFKFEHPDIRDTDKIKTMDVALDKALVKSRHILNFDDCSSIVYKTFNIFATTSITDEKDVKVILVNGKDDNVKCQVPYVPIVPHTIKPVSNTYSKSTEIPVVKAEVGLLTISLGIGLAFSTIVSIVSTVTLVYVMVIKRNNPKNNMDVSYMQGGDDSDDQVKSLSRGAPRGGRSRNEKCVPGGDDSDDDEEKCEVKSGVNVTTTCLEQGSKTFKILKVTAILSFLLAIILIVAIFTT